jgi:hypothetical protein
MSNRTRNVSDVQCDLCLQSAEQSASGRCFPFCRESRDCSLCQTAAARHVISSAAVLITTHMAQARGRLALTLVITNWGIT